MKNYLNNRELTSRFWEKVERKESDECWNWIAGTQSKGYGSFGIGNGKTDLAHRVAYELRNGDIPNDMCVMHSCDNRKCCNPAHLKLGSIADNNRDMVEKGRQASGMQNGMSKLTLNNVVSMRSDYQAKEKTLKDLAEEYDIHYNTARNKVHGKTWKDLPLAE